MADIKINSKIKLFEGATNTQGNIINEKYQNLDWRVIGINNDGSYRLRAADENGSYLDFTVNEDQINTANDYDIRTGSKVLVEENNDRNVYNIFDIDEKSREAIYTSVNNDGEQAVVDVASLFNKGTGNDKSVTIMTNYLQMYGEELNDDTEFDESEPALSETNSGVTTNTSEDTVKFTNDVKVLNVRRFTEDDIEYVSANTNQGDVKIPAVDFDDYVVNMENAINFTDELKALYDNMNVDNDDIYKFSTRLFGIPHQFTPYCDQRLTKISKDTSQNEALGRKFIENMMLDAPVITIIPGKPLYLPGNKNKRAATLELMAMHNTSDTLARSAGYLSSEEKRELFGKKAKYYDFQPDFLEYYKYVNVLCGVAAAFLDIGTDMKYSIDGKTPLGKYDWKNYRWLDKNYISSTAKVSGAIFNVVRDNVRKIPVLGKMLEQGSEFINSLNPFKPLKGIGGLSGDDIDAELEDEEEKVTNEATEGTVNADSEPDNTDESGVTDALADNGNEDVDLIGNLEAVLTSSNYVQFYSTLDSGASESNTNSTKTSELSSMFSQTESVAKEIAFIAGSGGGDLSSLYGAIDNGLDALGGVLQSATGGGAISTLMSRLLSNAGNILKGESMIFPQIYESSSYRKSYSLNVELVSIYGCKYSYFLNVLVPLFHLMALALPRYGTANTYTAPFLVRAYYPGTFNCNLGIIENLSIQKNPDGDAWTVDGYPSKIKVSVEITDLYSDLMISKAGNIFDFLTNSSLIEFLANTCGINLVYPNLSKRWKAVVNVFDSSIKDLGISVYQTGFEGLDNLIQSLAGI